MGLRGTAKSKRASWVHTKCNVVFLLVKMGKKPKGKQKFPTSKTSLVGIESELKR